MLADIMRRTNSAVMQPVYFADTDGWVTKLDNSGNLVWTVQPMTDARSLDLDEEGFLYASGYADDSVGDGCKLDPNDGSVLVRYTAVRLSAVIRPKPGPSPDVWIGRQSGTTSYGVYLYNNAGSAYKQRYTPYGVNGMAVASNGDALAASNTTDIERLTGSPTTDVTEAWATEGSNGPYAVVIMEHLDRVFYGSSSGNVDIFVLSTGARIGDVRVSPTYLEGGASDGEFLYWVGRESILRKTDENLNTITTYPAHPTNNFTFGVAVDPGVDIAFTASDGGLIRAMKKDGSIMWTYQNPSTINTRAIIAGYGTYLNSRWKS